MKGQFFANSSFRNRFQSLLLGGKSLSCLLSLDCLIFQVVLKSFVLLLQRKNYVQKFLLLVSILETMIHVKRLER